MTVTYEEFEKVEIRIGKVIQVEDFPNARKPAYKLWIDFGELGLKKSSAQITHLYEKEELVERLVIAVTNFPPRQVADFRSEVLVLGAVDENGECIGLLECDRPRRWLGDRSIPLGRRIL